MLTMDVPIRVRYNETDQMRIVHHSNYIFYYEVARTEVMRALGTSYREMEEGGVMLVVHDVHLHYVSPAHYDEIITVRTSIRALPMVKCVFDFEIYGEDGRLINTGDVTLASVDSETRKPCRCPGWFVDLIKEHSGDEIRNLGGPF